MPLSRWSGPDLARELAARRGIAASASTVRRWLAGDALKPWQHRSWISIRDPQFATRAARVLDLYAGIWDGRPLGENDYVICADEKTSIQAGTAAALRAVTCGKTWRLPRLGVGQPPRDHVCVTKQNTEAAAAVRICARTAGRERAELLERLRPCFARTEPWLQAGKYLGAVMSELPERNGWSVARHCGDTTPDRTQRLLNHAVWDTLAAMGVVRRFAVAGLDEAARKGGRRRGHLVIGALDETGQEKKGECTAGVKRQHMGCADGIANGINTVHLSYVREKTGHALIGARQWVPREHIADPVKSLTAGLPLDLEFRTKGQLATDICAEATADGVTCDFYCGDEVYGNCTELREYFETSDQAYVLRVPSNFRITLRSGTVVTCAEAVATLLKHPRRWEIRSAGKGSKGDRWYAWAWIGTASPRHHLLIRRHIRTGELAFHYCFMPEGQLCTKTRLIRAAGLRWPIEEGFEFGKDCFGLDQSQVRLYAAIARHAVLVMAALAICAVTAALLRDRTDTQAPPPVRPGQEPPADPGMIPLTVPRSSASSPPALPGPGLPATSSTGTPGPAPTRLAHDGSTSASDSPETLKSPWSASKVRLRTGAAATPPCRRAKPARCASSTTTTGAARWPTWPPGTSAADRSPAGARTPPGSPRSPGWWPR